MQMTIRYLTNSAQGVNLKLSKVKNEGLLFFSDAIERFAEKLKIPILNRNKNYITLHFVRGDRTQNVDLKLMGYDFRKNVIIKITSKAMDVSKGTELTLAKAVSFLRANSKMMHGAWAIEEERYKSYLIVQDTLILDTLDLDEFEAAVLTVAAEADRFERKFHKDKF